MSSTTLLKCFLVMVFIMSGSMKVHGENPTSSDPKGDELYQELLAVVAQENYFDIQKSTRVYFDHLNSHKSYLSYHSQYFYRLMVQLASKLAVTRKTDLIVDDHEQSHEIFWKGFTNLCDEREFIKVVNERNSDFVKIYRKLMLRLLHFIRNRRRRLFTHLYAYLLRSLDAFPEISNTVHLHPFISSIPALLPPDSTPWLDDKTDDRISLPPLPSNIDHDISDFHSKLLTREKIAAAVLEHASELGVFSIVEKLANQYVKTIIEKTGSSENPLAFCDRFFVFTPTRATDKLKQPILIFWYIEPSDRFSQVPEFFKGNAIEYKPYMTENGYKFEVTDLNSESELQGGFQICASETIAGIEQDLLKSSGRYITAVISINRRTVRCLQQCYGSLDFSGNLNKAKKMLESGDSESAIALLEKLAVDNKYLSGAYLLIALEKRKPGTPDAFEAARSYLERELERNPNNYRALSSLAITEKKQGRIAEAIDLFEKSYQIHPYYIDNLISYASSLLILGPDYLDKILPLCGLAYDISPSNPYVKDFFQDVKKNIGLDLPFFTASWEADTRLH